MVASTADARYVTRSFRQGVERYAKKLRRELEKLEAAESDEVAHIERDFAREKDRLNEQIGWLSGLDLTPTLRRQARRHASSLVKEVEGLPLEKTQEIDRVREAFRRERARLTQQLALFQETGAVIGLDPDGVGVAVEKTRVRLKSGELDPRVQAGPENIARARAVFEEAKGGEVAQVLLSQDAGIGSGQTTWAIKALLLDGVIEDAGRSETTEAGGHSRVYRLRKRAKGARVSTLRPGQ